MLPSNRPCRGSIVGNTLFRLDDGESVWVVLLIVFVKPSWPTSKERVVSPFGKLVTFVNELFGVRRSSILYLKWLKIKNIYIYDNKSYGGRAMRSLTTGSMWLMMIVVVVEGNDKSPLNKFDTYSSKQRIHSSL